MNRPVSNHVTEDERTALLMGLASLEEAARIRAHAAECESCRQALADDREIKNSLNDLAIPSPSPERWDLLFVVPPSGGTKPHRRSLLSALPLWVMRAAIITLTFASGYWMGNGSRQTLYQPTIQPSGWASTRPDDSVRIQPTPTAQRMLSMADDTTTERRPRPVER